MSDSGYTVTQKEAADFLNVSTKTISRYRKKGLSYKMMLNPVTGKQEVRFQISDLERWDEGRQLLANHGQDGETVARNQASKIASQVSKPVGGDDYLAELLEVYKEQAQVLREQLSDMRGQLARRDQQIDDLMRLMVGLRLEHKPQGVTPATPTNISSTGKKVFNREQLAESILRLRQRGKSYEEIAQGLNHINAAAPSGEFEWTVDEVQSLLPSLVDSDEMVINGDF